MSETEEMAGLGVATDVPDDVLTDALWKVLLVKVQQPNLFLPVTDVIARPSDDGNGTYREMSMGPNRIIENIYSDESNYEIVFDVIDDNYEIVNVIVTDSISGKRSLEYYKRLSATKERMHWAIPKKIGLASMVKIFDMARTL